MKLCAYPDCGRPLLSRGLCQSHYWQQRRGEELRPIQAQNKPNSGKPCRFPGCERHAIAKGLCSPHRRQELRGQELQPIRGEYQECTVEGCHRRVSSKGHCQTHARYRQGGQELKAIHVPTYRYDNGEGYVLVRDPQHPNAQKSGLVLEHVKVLSEKIGRPLLPGETVHHINGQRADNRPENLRLWAGHQPKGQDAADLLAWAREIVARYEPVEDKL